MGINLIFIRDIEGIETMNIQVVKLKGRSLKGSNCGQLHKVDFKRKGYVSDHRVNFEVTHCKDIKTAKQLVIKWCDTHKDLFGYDEYKFIF